MPKKTAVRGYTLADADLAQLADDVVHLVQRDSTEFATRGVNAARLTAFKAKRDDFKLADTDQFMESLKMVKTETKNNLRDQLEVQLRTLITMAENTWERGSAHFKSLGDLAVSQMTDQDLVRNANNIIRVCTAYLTALAPEGMTSPMLVTAEIIRISFDDSIDEQVRAIQLRDIRTEERINLGNALYDEVVKICNSGKNIWENVNEAKYNDYVIYSSTSAKNSGNNLKMPPEPPKETP